MHECISPTVGTSSATSLLELDAKKDLKEDRSVVLYPCPVLSLITVKEIQGN